MFKLFVGKTTGFLQKSLMLLLKNYQYFISPLLGPRCRFEPTCSQYAIDALTHLSLLRGCYLIAKRLLRCHPFHEGGYDPLVLPKERAINKAPLLKS